MRSIPVQLGKTLTCHFGYHLTQLGTQQVTSRQCQLARRSSAPPATAAYHFGLQIAACWPRIHTTGN